MNYKNLVLRQRIEKMDSKKTDHLLFANKTMPLQCTRLQFLVTLEKMLCFNALYRSSYNFVGKSWNDKQEFQMNVRKMMMMIKVFVPCSEGNGWKLQKFHELLHLVMHIDDYGSPLNFDTGTGERGLKDWVKKFAKLFNSKDNICTTLKSRNKYMNLQLFKRQ